MIIDGVKYGEDYSTYAIVGAKKQGKTTLIQKIWNQHKGNGLYYSFRPNDSVYSGDTIIPATLVKSLSEIKKPGKYKTDVRYLEKEEFFEKSQHFRNCLVILDDSSSFMGYRINRDFATFLINNRGFHCTTILVFHGFYNVPDEVFTYVDYIFAFKTREGINKNLKTLPSCYKIVNAHRYLSTAKNHTKVFIDLNS